VLRFNDAITIWRLYRLFGSYSCNLGVHQICYGVKELPEGQWFCRPCEKESRGVRCCICFKSGGAMKPTLGAPKLKGKDLKRWQDGAGIAGAVEIMANGGAGPLQWRSSGWAHVICAQYMPCTYFKDPDSMEPIAGIEGLGEDRYMLSCAVCKANGLTATGTSNHLLIPR
jgi:hypothetical protein